MSNEAQPPATDAPAQEEESTAHFEPVVKLSDADKVEVSSGEEGENELFKMRAKLFRFDKASNEWKERGTGDMKLLEHKESKKIRVLMRRDKTHKICANHYISQDMNLLANIGSDRSWVWTAAADISDGEPSAETLAVRFANSENANAFKDKFNEAKESNSKLPASSNPAPPAAESSSSEAKTDNDAAAAAAAPGYEAGSSSTDKPQSELSPAELKAQEAAKEAEASKQEEGSSGQAPPPAYE